MNPNPLVPATYDIVTVGVSVIYWVAMIVAVVSLSRASKDLSLGQLGVWLLIVLFVPLIGPIVWLVSGRKKVRAARTLAAQTTAVPPLDEQQ
ncbi:PLD nuclease N-terminal domain-containing protein [Leucobacter salsicius]|uniref:PLD nuclease N-terminal domain-containing protein n=1 Tax=Leucobacter salsicius TaxID=664638 RepID=UPI00034965C6|nr:PLD nuclease N-terminal domain-containing protein [Leucobacter salsicius]